MRRPGRHALPETMIRALKAGRRWAHVGLTPFDYLWRAINGKGELPPLYLRRYVGPLRSFESSGAEFMAYLRLLCRLQPTERVLDIGCGCGQMALQLLDYLNPQGSYVGLDIHRPSIKWCLRKIGSKHKRFEFQYLDVKSDAYNPGGRHSPDSFSFPFEAGEFDLILLKSVFTHMRPQGVDNYLGEVARLLSNDGRCLATLFLLNEQQRRLAAKGLNRLDFAFGEDDWRSVYEHSPESAMAYDESFIMRLLEKHGLALKQPVLYGSWSGLSEGLSYQDILLLEKR